MYYLVEDLLLSETGHSVHHYGLQAYQFIENRLVSIVDDFCDLPVYKHRIAYGS